MIGLWYEESSAAHKVVIVALLQQRTKFIGREKGSLGRRQTSDQNQKISIQRAST